jgi:hypothetical protein
MAGLAAGSPRSLGPKADIFAAIARTLPAFVRHSFESESMRFLELGMLHDLIVLTKARQLWCVQIGARRQRRSQR